MSNHTLVESECIEVSLPRQHVYADTLLSRTVSWLNRRFEIVAKVLQLVLDYLIVYFSFQLSYVVWEISPFRQQVSIQHPDSANTALVSVFVLFIMMYSGAYEKQASIANVRMHKNMVKGLIFASIFVIAFTFFNRSLQIGRLQVVYFLLISVFAVSVARALFDRWLLYLLRKGIGARRVLIFGAGETGKRLAKAMEKYPRMGYSPVGFVDDGVDRVRGLLNPLPVLGTSRDIQKIVKRYHVDEVIFAVPSSRERRMSQLIDVCVKHGIPYKFVPNLQEVALQKVRSEDIDGIPVFSIKKLGYRPLNAVIKRIFDVSFSTFVLLMSLPLFAIVAVAIKLDSKGPVFFRQKRVGQNGKLFTLYKFRTMYVDAPSYAHHPRDRKDPRITRVGRFLRRTSIDELPQFINVLKGEMSVVGPRPEMPFIVEEYNHLHRERLNVKPGITGLWQISADRNFPIHENIDHDLYYIENQSFLVDLIIIVRTVFVAIAGVGAK